MVDDFAASGISPVIFSVMFLLGTFGAGVGSFFYGQLIDHYGARLCMPGALLALAASVVFMANIGPDAALPWWLLPFAFFGVRSCALGCVNPWINTVIGQWFRRRRGKAVVIPPRWPRP